MRERGLDPVKLASLETILAKPWAKTPELKADRWSESVAARTIVELGALAAEAIAKKSDLLLRMSM